MTHPVVHTNVARCRDCYRCVRTCLVKAVRVENAQAQVVPELCIVCGQCVPACPQGAKTVRDDRPAVQAAIDAGRTVIASVAPSAPAFFPLEVFGQIEDALKALGFAAAEETAFGAQMVGQAHRELVDCRPEHQPVISSSCPAVVSLVEQYYPDLIPFVAPVVSPMIAHGRWIREKYGEDAYVVFVGPCIAKKGEAREPAVAGAVDAALTFEELEEWMAARDVALPRAEPDGEAPGRVPARLFPVEGGLVGTANMDTDMLARRVVTTSGLENCRDVLKAIRTGELRATLVELMACEGGCINGPGMGKLKNVTLARQKVMDYAARRQPKPMPERGEWPELGRTYSDRHVDIPWFSEEQIREVLQRVEKYVPEDELNCGACGYPTCRDKAIATLRGLAEATMCMPYMRRRAESLRQVMMAAIPDPIVVVDAELHLQDMSSSAEKLFGRRMESVKGLPLDALIPATDGFARVRSTRQPILHETVRLRDNLIVEQTVVPVEGQSLFVGILRDVTERTRQQEQLDNIRTQTLANTQEVIKKQMRVAHEIAQLLGETTAETKIMLSRLAKVLEEEENGG